MKRQNKKGFTLIELLVVIAIIALLLSIIMPSLNAAKKKAQSIVCLANLNGLSKCWMLYAGDNNDEVVGANTRGVEGAYYCWVEVPQDDAGAWKLSGSTVDEKINGIKKGLLFPYVDNYKVYHCPGDKRSLKPPANTGYSGMGGYRSYSIVDGVRGEGYDSATGQYSGLYGSYYCHTKITTIKSPGSKYTFLEEVDGRGFNVNSWAINPTNPDHWTDPIAIWHGDSSTFGYADGHGERHKWHQKDVIKMAEEQKNSVHAPGEDTEFMHLGYPYLKLLP